MQAIMESFRDEEMGGRVYACMVGSAPSAPEVVTFLREALGAPILESFGSTETGEGSPVTAVHGGDGSCMRVAKLLRVEGIVSFCLSNVPPHGISRVWLPCGMFLAWQDWGLDRSLRLQCE